MTGEGQTPYPGLRAYRRDEAMLFFGREGCVDDMVDRLAKTRFLAVLGASGSGKSSLVRTGLLDALKLGLHPAGSRWLIAECHPGGRPIRNLAKALLSAKDGKVKSAFIDALEEFLRRGPLSVAQWATGGNLPAGQSLLIIVDQFEELFRYGDYAGREQAEAFVALLLESARADARIEVVITMRSEFLGACALIPGLAEQINKGLFLARRMTREECREAIEGPAGVVGFEIEPRLVTRILNDLSGFAPWDTASVDSQLERLSRQADQLPLMQHALSRLWQTAKRREKGGLIRLTLDDYLAIGELRGALDQHAGEVVASLSDAARPLVRPVFRALIAGTNLSDAVRKPTRFSELVSIVDAPRELVVEVVETFRAPGCSFLRPAPPDPLDDATIIDISHESLIRQWSSLAGWLSEEAQANGIWNRLTDAEERHARGEGENLTGVDLATALDWWGRERPTKAWAKAHGGDVTKVDAFLKESNDKAEAAIREQNERERRERERAVKESKRLRAVAAAAVGFAIVAFVAAWIARTNSLSLDEKNRQLDQKIAELDNSNNLLQSEKAKTDSANESLKAANDKLDVARARAEEATRDALTALEARKAANERSLTAMDNFITSQADRLIVTPGMSLDRAERMLVDGKTFLSGMAGEEKDQRRYDFIVARMGLRAAAAKNERGQYEDAIIQAAGARQALIRETKPEDLTAQEKIEYAASFRLESQSLGNLREFARSEAAARDAVSLVSGLTDESTDDVQIAKAKSWAQLSAALGRTGKTEEGLGVATRCLDDFADGPAPTTDDGRHAVANCQLLAATHRSRMPAPTGYEKHAQVAVDALADVPNARKTVPMLIVESTALLMLAENDRQDGRMQDARDRVTRIDAKLRDIPDIDMAQRPELCKAASSIYNQIGRMYLDERDYISALTFLDRGIELSDLGDWKANLDLAAVLDALLANQLAALDGTRDWTPAPQWFAKYLGSTERHAEILSHLAAAGVGCDGCELNAMQRQLSALTEGLNALGYNEDWYQRLADLAKQIAKRAGDTLDHPPSSVVAINARRAWLATVTAQIDNADLFTGSPADSVAKLGNSERTVRQFLARFPDSWIAKRKLGRISYALAGSFFDVGNKADAVKAAEEGARHFNRDAVVLLADWYRKGDGPVSRDVEKAKSYDAQLAKRSWGVAPVQLLCDQLWTSGQEKSRQDVLIEDRIDGDDNVVARIASQLEDLNGLKLAPDELQKLTRIEREAKAKNESFFDLAVAELSNEANSAEWIASQFQVALAKNSPDDVAKVINKQWSKTGGQDRIREALKQLLSKSGTVDLRNQLLASAKAFNRDDYREAWWGSVSAMFLDELIAATPPDATAMADLYQTRADAREKSGEPAETDRMISLILEPENANLLNLVGLDWADNDRDINASLELLRRAIEAEPENPDIKHGLGWAYVKARNIEKGLELIESALNARPRDAEILAHVGDVYRRLGRKEEAREKFARALALTSDFALISLILEGQQLLVDGNEAPAEVVDRAARLLAGTQADERIDLSTDEIGIAIRGFDPVAYFTKKHPELGSIDHVVVWRDALWLFSSAKHRDAFVTAPEKYAPAYGGFCAYCVAAGHKLHGNPAAWAIHNDRLYIHRSLELRQEWLRYPDSYISQADAKWPGLISQWVAADARSAFTNRILEARSVQR